MFKSKGTPVVFDHFNKISDNAHLNVHMNGQMMGSIQVEYLPLWNWKSL